ncbi:sensor histidine kinase [Paenibacillus rhizoplanae]
MVVQIDGLLKAVYVEQEQKRMAELKALQAQINPHFYTTHWILLNGRRSFRRPTTRQRWSACCRVCSGSVWAGGKRR